MPKSYDHLTVSLNLPDPAFDDFWQFYLKARPDLVEGATIELTREQLRIFKKLAFLAGREAALAELNLPGLN